MTRKFNFGAGPAILPTSVLEEVKQELLDWNGRGYSVMEISHRTDEYGQIAEEAVKDFRDLLKQSPVPVFIIPGDNGYDFCENKKQAKQFWDQYVSEFEKLQKEIIGERKISGKIYQAL